MGVLAIAMIGGGIGLVWSGTQGVNFLDVLKAVLSGDKVPRAATTGASTVPPSAVSPGAASGGAQVPSGAPSGAEPQA